MGIFARGLGRVKEIWGISLKGGNRGWGEKISSWDWGRHRGQRERVGKHDGMMGGGLKSPVILTIREIKGRGEGSRNLTKRGLGNCTKVARDNRTGKIKVALGGGNF